MLTDISRRPLLIYRFSNKTLQTKKTNKKSKNLTKWHFRLIQFSVLLSELKKKKTQTLSVKNQFPGCLILEKESWEPTSLKNYAWNERHI